MPPRPPRPPRMSPHPEPSDAPVLFFAACLVGAQPGTLYLTPYHLCLTFGLALGLGGAVTRVIYPLRSMDECVVVGSGPGQGAGMGIGLGSGAGAGAGSGSGSGSGTNLGLIEEAARAAPRRENANADEAGLKIGAPGMGTGSALLRQGLALMGRTALRTSFYAGQAELLLTPLYLEARQVRAVVVMTRDVFAGRAPPPRGRRGGSAAGASLGAGAGAAMRQPVHVSSSQPQQQHQQQQQKESSPPPPLAPPPRPRLKPVARGAAATAEAESGWDFGAKDLL